MVEIDGYDMYASDYGMNFDEAVILRCYNLGASVPYRSDSVNEPFGSEMFAEVMETNFSRIKKHMDGYEDYSQETRDIFEGMISDMMR